MRASYLLAALLPLAGCTVGPNYQRPELAVPPGYAEANRPGTPAELGQWWHTLRDPVLDRLIARGLSNNLDLASAASRIRRARYEIRSARSQGLPTLNGVGSVNRIELSKNGGFATLANGFGGGAGGGKGTPPGSGVGLPGSGFTTWTLGLDASWEIDFFGGVKRGVQVARARTEAAVWDSRDSAVSVAAEIADDYLALRLLQRREKIARAELARERQTLAILQARARTGIGPAVDVDRQLTQIATAEATLDPIIADARVQVHALAVLVGDPPEALLSAFAQPPVTDAATAVPDVPAGLPSDLLRRRPDVRAAERRLAAATADIGVAVSALYPKLNLTGAADLISTGLSNLFTKNSFQGSVTGAVNWPILDFGARRATIGMRREDREQAYIDYKQSVLVALRDTEDALARIGAERRRLTVLTGGTVTARRTVAAIGAQYRVGLTDLTTVLDAQAQLLQAQDTQAQSEGALQQDVVALYKALGGGWESLPTDPLPLAPADPGKTRRTTAAAQPTNALSTR